MDNFTSPRNTKEKRNLVSSIFVTLLLGLAYQEMIAPVRVSFRETGFSLGLITILVIFFLTSIRFFIGAQLHLLSDRLLEMGGFVWFYDFMWIVIEMTVMAFMGGVSSVKASSEARIDFFTFLIVLYSIDVAWIVSQYLLGKPWKYFRRQFIPWRWAILNSFLIAFILLLQHFTKDLYSTTGLIWLLVLNIGAFVIDVILVDYYNVL
jgi:CDP-diglyceride synthetase